MWAITSALVALGILSFPWAAPIVVGIAAAILSTVGISLVRGRGGNIGPDPVRFESYQDVLAAYVAKIVFLPVAGFALVDGPIDEAESKYIAAKMASWGYSDEYIQKLLTDFKALDLKKAKQEIENTVSFEAKSKYIKNNANVQELCRKAYSITRGLERQQGNSNTTEKVIYMDWLSRVYKVSSGAQRENYGFTGGMSGAFAQAAA
jgi:hypothetical protein